MPPHADTTASLPPNSVYHGPDVLRLSHVTPSRVRWLWDDRLALGKLTLLAGDPGLGKSYLTLDLAARVASGTPFPGDDDNRYGNFPRKVILLSAEDDPADTIRPRLDAAGADPDNILMLRGVRIGEHTRSLNLRGDIDHLDHLIRQLDGQCRLIIIDPISAYLGDDEGHSNTKVRNLLAPLATLAQEHDVAVLAVTHLNKGGGNGPTNAIYRTMGSLAFTAAARTVHLVARDPDDESRRLMLPIKNNLGHDRTGWGFALEPHPDTGHTRIAWDAGPTRENADELLMRLGRPTHGSDPRPSPALDEAKSFLETMLTPGPQPATAIQAAAEQAGIAAKTLRNARQALGVAVQPPTGPGTESVWSLSGVATARSSECLPFSQEGKHTPGRNNV